MISALVIALTLLGSIMTACGGNDNGVVAPLPGTPPRLASGRLIIASTTTTQDTGLLDELTAMFEEESGYDLQVIVGGSGQVIAQGSRGDADVLLVHSPAAEKKMVDDGNGIERAIVMHNDFIIVGPASDPARVKDAATAVEALQAIAAARSAFVSRGDDSGTHVVEKKLWEAAAVSPFPESWYEESGQGQGATLQIANQRQTYAMTDRGTWLAQNENLDLPLLFEGDPAMYNVYHVIVVNPDTHSKVNAAGARAFAAFLVRPDVQAFIGTFGADTYGEALFIPDAGKAE